MSIRLFKELTKEEQLKYLQEVRNLLESSNVGVYFICNHLGGLEIKTYANDIVALARKHSLEHMFNTLHYKSFLEQEKRNLNIMSLPLWSPAEREQRISFLEKLITKIKETKENE